MSESAWSGYPPIEERDAEIERLRKELAVEKGWVSQYRDSYCKQVVEIERLRKEIEPLHIALGLLTTIKPTMEIDITDPVGMAQQIAVHVADEIERLRGQADLLARNFNHCMDESARLRELLQWWIDAGPDADWDDYEARVHTALGVPR